jgi:hypothetical protein
MLGDIGPVDLVNIKISYNREWALNQVNNWKMYFCLWPRTCHLTGKSIWFDRCYRGTRMITGPGDPIIVDYYIDQFEFITWKLKQ